MSRIFSTVVDWLDERTGHRAAWRAWIEAPGTPVQPATRVLNAAVGSAFAVLVVTGLVLMTEYAPSPQSAWASVHYTQFVQPLGWLLRGLHYWAAQALFVLAAGRILYGAVVAAYRPQREIVWWLSLGVLGLAVAQGITGGLLPWDQRGWWARVVEGNIASLAPGLGGWLQQMMSGGPQLGAIGLTRAYVLHVVVLPLLLGGALWGAASLLRRERTEGSGIAGATRVQDCAVTAAVGAVVALALLAVAGWSHGAPLDGPADPLSDYPARPEWFLLTLYELRKFFHGAGEFWGTSLVPAAGAGYFVVLPWLDRPPRSRALAVVPALAIFGAAVGLGVMAARHDARDAAYKKARAKADGQAAAAIRLAMDGVPPAGALAMVREDPELRGRDLFDRHCASCHVLGDLGDPEKATASKLDGWSTPAWIEAMIHDPDAPEFFGRGPYRTEMPSVDVRPTTHPDGTPWKPMIKSDAEKHAVGVFLASLGDEAGDSPRDPSARAVGEKIVGERCTTCHLVGGDGDDEGTGLAPELAGYGSQAWTRAQIANPSSKQTYRENALNPELKKHMPRFDKDLSAADIDLVARWTRAHARGQSLP
jgi:ubiquinol-cytochrome c reductase cytochrome b subunit